MCFSTGDLTIYVSRMVSDGRTKAVLLGILLLVAVGDLNTKAAKVMIFLGGCRRFTHTRFLCNSLLSCTSFGK